MSDARRLSHCRRCVHRLCVLVRAGVPRGRAWSCLRESGVTQPARMLSTPPLWLLFAGTGEAWQNPTQQLITRLCGVCPQPWRQPPWLVPPRTAQTPLQQEMN